MSKPRLIAFYLPQYYPTPENNEWWMPGFTEWTNVAKARPLFHGHYQPKIPADLGFYDLRVPETREHQAVLAKEAGIEGFCYWHYWFAGRRLLDRVFREVVESGKPDFPFCLCWANHDWYQKTWEPNSPNRLLIKQTYPGEQDYIAHFNAMLTAFKDPRYMKVDGKLIFGIYSPLSIPDFKLFKTIWNRLAKENGLNGFYFVGFTFKEDDKDNILAIGLDAVTIDYTQLATSYSQNALKFYFETLKKRLFHIPRTRVYNEYCNYVLTHYQCQDNIYPCIIPNFDHSPRSGYRGVIFTKSTPRTWGNFCRDMFSMLEFRSHEKNLLFIKAWNEWGEGNYLEPDLKFGKQYIQLLRESYDSF